MAFLDEKIASLKQTQRILQEEENKQENDSEIKKDEKEQIELVEIIECIKNGYLEIEDRVFDFKTETYLDGKITMPIIDNYFKEEANNSNAIALINDSDGVTFVCSYVKENILAKNFDEFKVGMEINFKDMGMYLEWIDEGNIKQDDALLEYGIFKTPTAKGYMYNLIFFSKDKTNTQLILGNFNCLYNQINIWENVIKGIINLITIKL